jgi:hypothetical protein
MGTWSGRESCSAAKSVSASSSFNIVFPGPRNVNNATRGVLCRRMETIGERRRRRIRRAGGCINASAVAVEMVPSPDSETDRPPNRPGLLCALARTERTIPVRFRIPTARSMPDDRFLLSRGFLFLDTTLACAVPVVGNRARVTKKAKKMSRHNARSQEKLRTHLYKIQLPSPVPQHPPGSGLHTLRVRLISRKLGAQGSLRTCG